MLLLVHIIVRPLLVKVRGRGQYKHLEKHCIDTQTIHTVLDQLTNLCTLACNMN